MTEVSTIFILSSLSAHTFHCIPTSLLSPFCPGLLSYNSERNSYLLTGAGATYQQWCHQQTTQDSDFIQGSLYSHDCVFNLPFFHFVSVFQHLSWFDGHFRGKFIVGKRRKVTSYSCSCFMTVLKEYENNSKVCI